ncbi:MAG: energy transducer TonB [Gemmatimonadaceae bacterium]
MNVTRMLGSLLLVLAACGPVAARNVADSLPQLASEAVPFRYPLAMYEQRIEGDVTLRLHIDTSGAVVPESLRVFEGSGFQSLDSAALEGARQLQFRPARLGRRPVPLTVLFPVKFRVPAGARAPTDTNARIPGR